MSFFPLYVDMKHLKVLLVGAGNIATEKLEKLLDFTEEITIVALKVNAEIESLAQTHSLELWQRTYRKGDIEGFDIVIVATDTEELQKVIYEESRGKKIWVNSVDNVAYCDFIFPAYLQKGDLTISFSTSGASPAFAKYIRAYFENSVPDTVGPFLQKMKSLREILPKGKERMRYFDTLVKNYFYKHFK